MDAGRVRLPGTLGVHDCRQLLVVHSDELGSLECCNGIEGDHGCHRVTDEPHVIDGQRVSLKAAPREEVGRAGQGRDPGGEFATGHDGHDTGPGQRGGGVDTANERVGKRAPHERQVQ
ncbi:hypothetical protein HRbin26_01467 [bacterium HR26]|nr:hypothetical protein HRbin26_01467 [bacterium HR26]